MSYGNTVASKDPAKLAREARLASKGERGRGCSDGETEQVVFSFFKTAIICNTYYIYICMLIYYCKSIYIYTWRERGSWTLPGWCLGVRRTTPSPILQDFVSFRIASQLVMVGGIH